VYGRAGGLQIYELLGMAGECEDLREWVAAYEAGLAAWRAGDFAGAIGQFERARKLKQADAASSLMIERCRHQIDNPTADGWDGTTVARTK
jgi:adenylate cyclase